MWCGGKERWWWCDNGGNAVVVVVVILLVTVLWVAVVVWCKPGGDPRPPKGIMPGGIPGKPFSYTCREGGGAWLGQGSVAGSEDEVWVGRGSQKVHAFHSESG